MADPAPPETTVNDKLVITRLDQLRALSDPLRLRLVERRVQPNGDERVLETRAVAVM